MSEHFYPIKFSKIAPTKDKFEIKQSKTGPGLFTLMPFNEGGVIAEITGFLVKEPDETTIQLGHYQHLYDPYFAENLNHSCDPNIEINFPILVALRRIEVGEELRFDYEITEQSLVKPFKCRCGAENCRGLIEGWGK